MLKTFDFNNNHFEYLSSRQLDREFNKDLSIMVKTLKKLPEEERNDFKNLIAMLIDNYISNKIEKELDKSFQTLFKF